MFRQSLDGQWELEIPGYAPLAGGAVPVTVPGSVYSGLLENGKIEDPFYRDNELEALQIMDHDFIFTRAFDLEPGMADECGRFILVCEGLDTICDIELNGVSLGRVENMHRTWEYQLIIKNEELRIKNVSAGTFPEGACPPDTPYKILKNKNNTLRLTFRSPTRAIAERYAALPTDGSGDAMRGFTQLRKAHCMFGWDWGPRLPDAGIWRSICLLGIKEDEQRIDSVYIRQKHENGKVELSFDCQLSTLNSQLSTPDSQLPTPNSQLIVTVTSPSGKTWRSNGEPIAIENPQLWWPSGYGPQPLYTIKAEAGGDTWERRIGLRTLDILREKDEWGESFAFRVNGLPIFAMGANYIPQDNILSRVTPAKIRQLLEDCAAANYNCIRVWGGGYYPDDAFFDTCDELGLIVWQDFMFACGIYELTDEFEENIRAEIIDNIKRIRHHACLGLWCGNNELEGQYSPPNCFKHTDKQHADYTRIFGYIIPKTLKEHDPDTFYWPSSPSSGGDFDNPDDENRGDVHCWEVWHGMRPFSAYRGHYFRFVSEFGFQSFPDIKTISAFTQEHDRNVFSRVMEMHQRNGSANGKIVAYLAGTYLYPNDFELLLYASQLLQADAIRYGVEHWRRNRGRCMGAIYWQVNDIWPVASWASVDYYGRWKALHYFARRFFSPVMLSCMETGEMTERPSIVSQREPIRKAAQLCLANETGEAVSGTVKWALRDPSSAVIKSGEAKITAGAFSSEWLGEMDFSDCDELSDYLSYEFMPDLSISGDIPDATAAGLSPLRSGNNISLCGTALFCMPKHFKFKDPGLKISRSGDNITVTASAYAKSVEIYSNTSDFVLSDNYFDMNAGSVTVQVLRGNPEDLQVRSVYDIR